VTLNIRPARAEDAEQMCTLLNPIILQGGSTAHQSTFDPARMRAHYLNPPLLISCFLAELAGEIVGFQALEWCDPNWPGNDVLPSDWAVIASFVSPAAHRKGVGRAMFRETLMSAKEANVTTIDATIRADNTLGLAYYTALGFADYKRLPKVPLGDGTRIDRIRKRLDL